MKKHETVNKRALVKALAEVIGITHKQAEIALVAYSEVIKDFLMQGKRVKIIGFGSFDTKKTAARLMSIPGQKKKVPIDPKVKPTFSFAESFAREFLTIEIED